MAFVDAIYVAGFDNLCRVEETESWFNALLCEREDDLGGLVPNHVRWSNTGDFDTPVKSDCTWPHVWFNIPELETKIIDTIAVILR